MSPKRLLVVCAVVALPWALGSAQGATIAPPTEVFVLAGQSNMTGTGLPLTLSSPPTPRLLLWKDGGWQIASDPLAPPRKPGDKKDGIGPGMTFGEQLLKRQPGVRIGLLMCAVGATSIKDWDPDGPLYAACVNQMRASGGRIAGVLYLQGESEAQSLERAATWFPGFTKLLAAFRRDTALATFVLGEIGTLAPEFTGQQAVRDAQAEAARLYHLPTVRTADLPNNGIHFTVPAYRVIGARFATAWWRATHGSPAASGAQSRVRS